MKGVGRGWGEIKEKSSCLIGRDIDNFFFKSKKRLKRKIENLRQKKVKVVQICKKYIILWKSPLKWLTDWVF